MAANSRTSAATARKHMLSTGIRRGQSGKRNQGKAEQEELIIRCGKVLKQQLRTKFKKAKPRWIVLRVTSFTLYKSQETMRQNHGGKVFPVESIQDLKISSKVNRSSMVVESTSQMKSKKNSSSSTSISTTTSSSKGSEKQLFLLHIKMRQKTLKLVCLSPNEQSQWKKAFQSARERLSAGKSLYPAGCTIVETFSGDGHATAGEEASFIVQSRNGFGNICAAGTERVSVVLLPSEKVVGIKSGVSQGRAPLASSEIPVRIVVSDDGRRIVSFTPTEGGVFTAAVRVNGIEITGSPFFVPVAPRELDVSMLVCRNMNGSGIGSFIAGKPTRFEFLLQGSPCTGLEASDVCAEFRSIRYPDKLLPYIQGIGSRQKNGTVQMSVTIEQATMYLMSVFVRGTELSASPFEVKVEPAEGCARKCVVRDQYPGAFHRNVIAGEECECSIQTYDQFGNRRHCGGEVVDLLLREEGGVWVALMSKKVLDRKDGSYTVHYRVRNTGTYSVAVSVSGDGPSLPLVPFTLTVRPAAIHVPRCTAEGPGLVKAVSGEQTFFTLIAKDLYSNRLEVGGHPFYVEVRLANSNIEPVASVKDNEDGTYLVKFLPPLKGKYTISVSCAQSSLPIFGSPFTLTVVSTSKMLMFINKIPLRSSSNHHSNPASLTSHNFSNRNGAVVATTSSHSLGLNDRHGDEDRAGAASEIPTEADGEEETLATKAPKTNLKLHQPFTFLYEYDEDYFLSKNPQQSQRKQTLQLWMYPIVNGIVNRRIMLQPIQPQPLYWKAGERVLVDEWVLYYTTNSACSFQIYDQFIPEGNYLVEISMMCGQKYSRQAHLIFVYRASALQRKEALSAKRAVREVRRVELTPSERLRHPWARFQEGAFITQSTVHTMLNTGVAIMEPHRSKQTLVRSTASEYTILSDKGEAKTMDLAGYYPLLDPRAQTIGEEVIIVEGHRFSCRILRSTHVDVLRTDITDWYAQGDVDDILKMLPLKRVIKSGYHLEYSAVALHEKIRVGTRELRCIKMVGQMRTPISTTKVTYFHSNEVPGGVASFVFHDALSKIVNTTKLLEFGGELFNQVADSHRIPIKNQVGKGKIEMEWKEKELLLPAAAESHQKEEGKEKSDTFSAMKNSSIHIDFISRLPTELALKIFSYLNFVDLAYACQTSHRWYELANDHILIRMIDRLDMAKFLKGVTDRGLCVIASKCASNLKVINLEGCLNVSDVGLIHILHRCNALERILLKSCFQITDRGILSLSKCAVASQIRELDIRGCMVTRKCIVSLLQRCPALEKFYLCSIEDMDDPLLERVTQKWIKLKELSLHGCHRISERSLREAIPQLIHLKKLDIRACVQWNKQVVQSFQHDFPHIQFRTS